MNSGPTPNLAVSPLSSPSPTHTISTSTGFQKDRIEFSPPEYTHRDWESHHNPTRLFIFPFILFHSFHIPSRDGHRREARGLAGGIRRRQIHSTCPAARSQRRRSLPSSRCSTGEESRQAASQDIICHRGRPCPSITPASIRVSIQSHTLSSPFGAPELTASPDAHRDMNQVKGPPVSGASTHPTSPSPPSWILPSRRTAL